MLQPGGVSGAHPHQRSAAFLSTSALAGTDSLSGAQPHPPLLRKGLDRFGLVLLLPSARRAGPWTELLLPDVWMASHDGSSRAHDDSRQLPGLAIKDQGLGCPQRLLSRIPTQAASCFSKNVSTMDLGGLSPPKPATPEIQGIAQQVGHPANNPSQGLCQVPFPALPGDAPEVPIVSQASKELCPGISPKGPSCGLIALTRSLLLPGEKQAGGGDEQEVCHLRGYFVLYPGGRWHELLYQGQWLNHRTHSIPSGGGGISPLLAICEVPLSTSEAALPGHQPSCCCGTCICPPCLASMSACFL